MPSSCTRESSDQDLADWGGITTWLDQVPLPTREGQTPNKHIQKDPCRQTTMGAVSDDREVAGCYAPDCHHLACAPLRQCELSQHWFFFRWFATGFTTPAKMLRVLHNQLGNRTFRYYATLTDQRLYEVVLRFDRSQQRERRWAIVPSEASPNFDASASEAWNIDCCFHTLLPEVEFWAHRLGEKGGKYVFGDEDLLQDLLSEARMAVRKASAE